MVGNNYPKDDFDPNFAVDSALGEQTLYVPLRFWFCTNPGLALPLIALQYHEIKINIELEDVGYLIRNDGGNITAPVDTNEKSLEY